MLVRRNYLESNSQSIKFCLENLGSNLGIGSVGGLTFIPNMAYTFGSDPLAFKWNQDGRITFELYKEDCIESNFVDDTQLSIHYSQTSDIFECYWVNLTKDKAGVSQMDALDCNIVPKVYRARNDKVLTNYNIETVEKTKQLFLSPFTGDDILKALSGLSSSILRPMDNYVSNLKSVITLKAHPLSFIPFDELYEDITKEACNGTVEKTIDESTGLEIYNYYQNVGFTTDSRIIHLCCGLVIDSGSKAVVTKPFPRFFDDGIQSGISLFPIPNANCSH